jgi:hypothetical protein
MPAQVVLRELWDKGGDLLPSGCNTHSRQLILPTPIWRPTACTSPSPTRDWMACSSIHATHQHARIHRLKHRHGGTGCVNTLQLCRAHALATLHFARASTHDTAHLLPLPWIGKLRCSNISPQHVGYSALLSLSMDRAYSARMNTMSSLPSAGT